MCKSRVPTQVFPAAASSHPNAPSSPGSTPPRAPICAPPPRSVSTLPDCASSCSHALGFTSPAPDRASPSGFVPPWLPEQRLCRSTGNHRLDLCCHHPGAPPRAPGRALRSWPHPEHHLRRLASPPLPLTAPRALSAVSFFFAPGLPRRIELSRRWIPSLATPTSLPDPDALPTRGTPLLTTPRRSARQSGPPRGCLQ